MLKLDAISKKYDSKIALQNISLTIKPSTIFGLLGPNGAGKTTLIRILCQITQPDSGYFYINSEVATEKHQSIIGYLPEERGLYKKMKVHEQLLYLAQLKGMSKKDAIISILFWAERLQFSEWFNKKIDELSKGMQQKVQFAATVIHNPQIIILDEPFTGFDPINAELIRQCVLELKTQGKLIILSTHRMESAEALCDEIAMIHKSEIVLNGTISEIKSIYKKNQIKIYYEGIFPMLNPDFEIVTLIENQFAIINLGNKTVNQLIANCINHVEIKQIEEIMPTLNDIFIMKSNE